MWPSGFGVMCWPEWAGSSAFRALFQDYAEASRNKYDASVADGDRERLFCTCPTHPIAQGIPAWVDIPEEEMYGEFLIFPNRMMWYLRDGLQAVRCSAADAPLHVGWAKFSIFSRDTRNTPFTICR